MAVNETEVKPLRSLRRVRTLLTVIRETLERHDDLVAKSTFPATFPWVAFQKLDIPSCGHCDFALCHGGRSTIQTIASGDQQRQNRLTCKPSAHRYRLHLRTTSSAAPIASSSYSPACYTIHLRPRRLPLLPHHPRSHIPCPIFQNLHPKPLPISLFTPTPRRPQHRPPQILLPF